MTNNLLSITRVGRRAGLRHAKLDWTLWCDLELRTAAATRSAGSTVRLGALRCPCHARAASKFDHEGIRTLSCGWLDRPRIAIRLISRFSLKSLNRKFENEVRGQSDLVAWRSNGDPCSKSQKTFAISHAFDASKNSAKASAKSWFCAAAVAIP
jgi:hypothetical protein